MIVYFNVCVCKYIFNANPGKNIEFSIRKMLYKNKWAENKSKLFCNLGG